MAEDIQMIPDSIERPGRVIFAAPQRAFSGFLEFIRERGVMGLAIGFVLGSAVQKVVTAFVNDLLNPVIGILLGRAENIKDFKIGSFMIGDFVMVSLDFLILCLVIYTIFKVLGLEKLDKPKA